MSVSNPISIIWRKAPGGFVSTYHAPHVEQDRVTARCGEHVLQVRADDGGERWDRPLPRRAGDGTFFLPARDRFITDFRRVPERLSSIAAVGADGAMLWTLDLPSIVGTGVPAAIDDHLFVLAMQAGVGGVLYRIDMVRGARISTAPTPWGADALLPLSGDRFLVRNQLAENGSPGLYTMRLDASEPRPVSPESTWSMIRRGNRILTVSRAGVDLPRSLHMLDAESLSELWTAASANEAADFYEDVVYSMETVEGGESVVARQAESGAANWRTTPQPRQILGLGAGGPRVFGGFLGGTVVVERSTGRLLGEAKGTYSAPVVVGNRLYATGDGALLCASLV
jgi:hypothetical protein